MPEYRAAEDRLMGCVAERFGLTTDMPTSVKEADWRILFSERDQLLAPAKQAWGNTGPPLDIRIAGWAPDVAREAFLARYRDLIGVGL